MRARIVVLLLLLAFPVVVRAQNEALPVHGTFYLGQRFVDVSGREQRYREFFNLQHGPSASLELFGKPEDSHFVDSYGVDIYGVGSDPYSGGQARVGKTGRWDLRVNYRESASFWNRNDDAVHPAGLHGLTTNHDGHTERRFGSLHLNARATRACGLHSTSNATRGLACNSQPALSTTSERPELLQRSSAQTPTKSAPF